MTDVDISILLTGDTEIAELNQRWRGKDSPTDVLSFPQQEEGGVTPPQTPPGEEAPPTVLGDIAISLDTANRQAVSAGHSLELEIRHLLVHGMLHLMGHDHVQGGSEARRMKAEEKRILALLADTRVDG